MALHFWRPKARGLRRLTPHGFRLRRGQRGVSGVTHIAAPEKVWVPKRGWIPKKEIKPRLPKNKEKRITPTIAETVLMEAVKKSAKKPNQNQLQQNFTKQVAAIPGPQVYSDMGNGPVTKEEIDELITQYIHETTLTGNIGVVSMPFRNMQKKRKHPRSLFASGLEREQF